MFNFFDGISSIIQTIVDFVVSLVDGVVSLFDALGGGLSFIYSAIASLPSFLSVPALVMISACLVRFLIKMGAPDA